MAGALLVSAFSFVLFVVAKPVILTTPLILTNPTKAAPLTKGYVLTEPATYILVLMTTFLFIYVWLLVSRRTSSGIQVQPSLAIPGGWLNPS